jgi:hypothetical protein
MYMTSICQAKEMDECANCGNESKIS